MHTLKAQMSQLYTTPSNFHFGSMGGYLTFAEVGTELDNMRALYPNLISARQSLGLSIHNRDIWMVKISDNPGTDESEQETLYTALINSQRLLPRNSVWVNSAWREVSTHRVKSVQKKVKTSGARN